MKEFLLFSLSYFAFYIMDLQEEDITDRSPINYDLIFESKKKEEDVPKNNRPHRKVHDKTDMERKRNRSVSI